MLLCRRIKLPSPDPPLHSKLMIPAVVGRGKAEIVFGLWELILADYEPLIIEDSSVPWANDWFSGSATGNRTRV